MCAACARVDAVNTCGTDTFVRIRLFTAGTTTGVNGEVAAAGYADPMAVVDGWMFEAAGADGHRRNLTDQDISSNTMGYGRAAGTGCFSSFDVSDSGNLPGAAIPKLPTAAVRAPTNGAAGSYAFYATWADPGMGAPSSLNVVVDGACTAMAREIGTDTVNATYKTTLTLAAGCHNYFVVAKDAAGATLTFPTTGAITIPVGGATACTSDFLATAPAASCVGDGGAPPPPPPVDAAVDRGGAGSGGATGTGGNRGTGGSGSGGANGAAGARGTGGSNGVAGASGTAGNTGSAGASGTGGRSSGAAGGAAATDAATTPPGESVSGGCACSLSDSESSPLMSGAALAVGALLVSRRRRQARS
jgi:MYXO-CTERM domain-containing protein